MKEQIYMKELIFKSCGKVIAHLIWNGSRVEIKELADSVKNDFTRTVEDGLMEIIGTCEDFEHRITLSNDVKFLPRLKNYFDRCYPHIEVIVGE